MRKNLIPMLVIALALISIGSVSAMSSYDSQVIQKMSNPLSQLNYALSHGFYLFTSAGQAAGCSVNPDWQGWIRGSMNQPSSLPNSISCSKVGAQKCAIDKWYDNTIYLGNSYGPPSSVNWNNYNGETLGTGISFSSSAYPYWFVQVYACPVSAPTQPATTTSAYVCNSQTGNWMYEGTFGQNDYCSFAGSANGNRCWCSGTNNFYVDQSGNVHCVSSPSSSWCTVPSVPTVPPTSSPPSPVTVCRLGDTNNDGTIELNEVTSYVSQWINGQVTRNQLGVVLMEWSNGC